MRALRQRVDARIGSTGAMHAHGLRTNLEKGPFQAILDRIAVRLALPSGERGAVVGNDQLEPRRHLIALNTGLRIVLPRALQPVEIPLQDHLRRHLIHEAPRSPRLLPTLA